ncbi:MAG: rhodanese-like domain-containing protein [Actinomycetes bacterium]|jgi:phage shock protein E
MRPTTWLAPLVIAAALLTGCSTGSDAVTDVDVAEAQQIVDEGTAVILDVRTPEEFAAGHLPGAININVESSDFETQVTSLDESAETLVYCRTDNRSGVATDQMAELGFTDVSDLQGGIEAWAAAGEPVVR